MWVPLLLPLPSPLPLVFWASRMVLRVFHSSFVTAVSMSVLRVEPVNPTPLQTVWKMELDFDISVVRDIRF